MGLHRCKILRLPEDVGLCLMIVLLPEQLVRRVSAVQFFLGYGLEEEPHHLEFLVLVVLFLRRIVGADILCGGCPLFLIFCQAGESF